MWLYWCALELCEIMPTAKFAQSGDSFCKICGIWGFQMQNLHNLGRYSANFAQYGGVYICSNYTACYFSVIFWHQIIAIPPYPSYGCIKVFRDEIDLSSNFSIHSYVCMCLIFIMTHKYHIIMVAFWYAYALYCMMPVW